MDKPSFYSILTADVRYDPRLKRNADCKVLYSEITALANKQGYCHATNTYFSNLYDRPVPTISKWINLLKKLGYLRVVMVKDGKQITERRLYPISTPINANVKGYSREHEEGYSRSREGGINADVKENNTSINNTSKNNTHSASTSDAPSVSQLEDDFDRIWARYPNKKGKKAAFNHYKAWRKKSAKHTDDYLNQKLDQYLLYCQQNSWYHPMNGSTWFNGRFDDELTIESNNNQFGNNSFGQAAPGYPV